MNRFRTNATTRTRTAPARRRRGQARDDVYQVGQLLGMPSIKTTVVVRGRPNGLQAGGHDAGRKLMEITAARKGPPQYDHQRGAVLAPGSKVDLGRLE